MENYELEPYTKHGKFILHSGQISDVLYDVKSMICNGKLPIIANNLNKSILNFLQDNNFTIVGIESAGAIIATYTAYIYNWKLAIITKNNEIVGNIIDEYCIIDDVVTTENSLRNAIKLIGKEPKHIFCVIDRRKYCPLKIECMFKV